MRVLNSWFFFWGLGRLRAQVCIHHFFPRRSAEKQGEENLWRVRNSGLQPRGTAVLPAYGSEKWHPDPCSASHSERAAYWCWKCFKPSEVAQVFLYFFFKYQNLSLGTGEIAQRIKCLPHQHTDWSGIPRTHMSARWAWQPPVIPAFGKPEQDPWSTLAS